MHFAGQFLKQTQHLRLGRNVEPGNDFIGQNEIRPQHHGARNADALPLAAGKLERITIDRVTRQADAVEHVVRPAQRAVFDYRPGRAAARLVNIRPIVCRGLSDDIGSWKIICMRRRSERRVCSSTAVISLPSNTIDPAAGCTRPSSARPSVVLPEPNSPTMPTVSPLPTRISTSCRTACRRAAAHTTATRVRARPTNRQPLRASAVPASKAAISARKAAMTSGGVGSNPVSGRS